jgi:hypothetical protein
MPPVGFEPTISVGERPARYLSDVSVVMRVDLGGPRSIKQKKRSPTDCAASLCVI